MGVGRGRGLGYFSSCKTTDGPTGGQGERSRGVKGGLGWSDIDCLGAWRTGGLEDSPFNKMIFKATF